MTCGLGRTLTTAVFAIFMLSPCVVLTLIRTSWRAFPRGLTQTVIGSPVVRGNRFAISKGSSLSCWEASRTAVASECLDVVNARPCAGYPRKLAKALPASVDGRVKPRQDERRGVRV